MKKRKLLRIVTEEGYVAFKLHSDDSSVTNELVSIENKLRSAGHLLEANDAEIVPNPGDLYGLGSLIMELADELRQIRNFVEFKKWGDK